MGFSPVMNLADELGGIIDLTFIDRAVAKLSEEDFNDHQ
jgi:hypothetical protein